MSKELKKVENQGLTVNDELISIFGGVNNFDGGEEPELPRIKVLSQVQMFELESGEKVDELQGVIIFKHRINSYWKDKFGQGEDNLPTCCSLDGIKPTSWKEKQAETCISCPKNKFGSDEEGGKGKACRNMIRLFILRNGNTLPESLTLPPTSLRVFSKYLVQLSAKKIPYQLAITKFTLEKKENYSIFNFECVDVIKEKEKALKIKEYIDKFKQQMLGMEVVKEDYSESSEEKIEAGF